MILRVAALQHLGDVAGVDPVAGAQPVELQVDGQQRIHDLEVDLPRPVLKRAGVVEVLTDLGQRLAGEVVALEVSEPELELPLALLPDGVEVAEELGHVLLDARRAIADLPLRGDGHLTLVEERAAHALHQAAGRRERQLVCGELRRPRCSGDELEAEWREAAWPVEVDEPEPRLVFLRERAGLHPQPRIVDVLRLPARIPLEELVDGNDLCHGL